MSGMNVFLFLLLGFVGVLTVLLYNHNEREYEEACTQVLQQTAAVNKKSRMVQNRQRITADGRRESGSFLPVYAAVVGMQDTESRIRTDFISDVFSDKDTEEENRASQESTTFCA